MPNRRPFAGLRELSESECFSFLASATHGRLATTQHALPTIVPVRIWQIGDELIVASLLGEAVPPRIDSVVALQVGTLGKGLETDWSVEVRGFLRDWRGLIADRGEDSYGVPTSQRFLVTADHVRGWSIS
jgi:hypothetical protein